MAVCLNLVPISPVPPITTIFIERFFVECVRRGSRRFREVRRRPLKCCAFVEIVMVWIKRPHID